MTVLVYSNNSRRGAKLCEMLEASAGDHPLVTVAGIKSLSEWMRKPNFEIEAAVLLLSSRAELNSILNLQEALFTIPLLLALPDRGEETVSKGYSLRPRYVTFLDSGFEDLAAVMDRFLEREERLRPEWSLPKHGRKGPGHEPDMKLRSTRTAVKKRVS